MQNITKICFKVKSHFKIIYADLVIKFIQKIIQYTLSILIYSIGMPNYNIQQTVNDWSDEKFNKDHFLQDSEKNYDNSFIFLE